MQKFCVDLSQNHLLVITRWDEPTITVDNIEVAQFIYLMLHNQKIRDVIDAAQHRHRVLEWRKLDPGEGVRGGREWQAG